MTRKDFEVIAATLARCKPETSGPAFEEWRDVCGTFAETLHTINPRFQRDRFFEACGMTERG